MALWPSARKGENVCGEKVGKTATPLESARSAVERHAWSEALALLKQADASNELDADGLEMLADAAWWMGQPADSVAARERACLEPRRRPLDSPVRLGPYRYFASFYACRSGLGDDRLRDLEARLAELAGGLSAGGDTVWGVSRLAGI